VKRRVSKRKGCKSKENESKRNGFATRPRVSTASGNGPPNPRPSPPVSQFVVRSPRRLHCAAGTAALRVYETRHYLALRPFPGERDGVSGKTLPARRVLHPQKRRTPADSRGSEPTASNEKLAHSDPIRIIDVQNQHSCSTVFCFSNEDRTAPTKVLNPHLPAGIE